MDMAYAGIQATVEGLTIRINQLQNEQMDISNNKLEMLRQSGNLAKDYAEAKNVIRGMYDSDSTAYEIEMDKIEEEYEFNSAKIAALESQDDMQSQEIQTESKEATEQKESYQSMLKQNIKADYKYAQG